MRYFQRPYGELFEFKPCYLKKKKKKKKNIVFYCPGSKSVIWAYNFAETGDGFVSFENILLEILVCEYFYVILR